MLEDSAILKPLFVQVSLTFVLLFWMAKERFQAVKRGDVLILDPGVRPIFKGRAGIISNAFHNQLEMPILFYVVVLIALRVEAVDGALVSLAWAYVGLRIVHALIHVTYNKILHRFWVYALSSLILIGLWGKVGSHLFI